MLPSVFSSLGSNNDLAGNELIVGFWIIIKLFLLSTLIVILKAKFAVLCVALPSFVSTINFLIISERIRHLKGLNDKCHKQHPDISTYEFNSRIKSKIKKRQSENWERIGTISFFATGK